MKACGEGAALATTRCLVGTGAASSPLRLPARGCGCLTRAPRSSTCHREAREAAAGVAAERQSGQECPLQRGAAPRPSSWHRGRPALASPGFQAERARCCSGQREGGTAGRGGRKEGSDGADASGFPFGAGCELDGPEGAGIFPARQRRCRFCLRAEFAPAALYLAAAGTNDSLSHAVKSRGRCRWFGSFAGVRAAKGPCERETGASSFVRRHPPSLQLYLVARRVFALSCGCWYYVKEQRDFMPHCPTGTSFSCPCLQSC